MPALPTTVLEPLVQMLTQKTAMQSYPNGFHLSHLTVEGKYFEFGRDLSMPM